jgi:hypothetical protein
MKSAFSLFQPSKEAVLKNFVSFMVIIFLPAFVSNIGDALHRGRGIDPLVNPVFPAYWAGGLLALLLLPAGLYLELHASKGQTISVGEAISKSLKFYWRIIGLILLVGLIIFVGLVLLIVPGVIMITRYFFAPYLLIDRDLTITEAMKQSTEMSKGKAGAVWSVIGVTVLLSLFGIVPIFGGLIVTILLTLYTCAPALRYLEVKKLHKPSRSTVKS